MSQHIQVTPYRPISDPTRWRWLHPIRSIRLRRIYREYLRSQAARTPEQIAYDLAAERRFLFGGSE